MALAGERSAHLRYGELTFNGKQTVFEPAKCSQDEHAAARHVVFFASSPQSYTGAFNAAEEAKLCCPPENYGRNPDRSPARSMRDHAGGQFVRYGHSML
jgi:hypothetical protein